MEPERLFSWRWHPHPDEPGRDYSSEPTTLVVFADRLQKAYQGNESGWSAQMENISRYVGSTASRCGSRTELQRGIHAGSDARFPGRLSGWRPLPSARIRNTPGRSDSVPSYAT
jgi:hypothetical protein